METPFESKYEKYVVHLIGHKSCYNLFNIFKIIILLAHPKIYWTLVFLIFYSLIKINKMSNIMPIMLCSTASIGRSENTRVSEYSFELN